MNEKLKNLDLFLNKYRTMPIYYIVYSNRRCSVDIQINNLLVEKVTECETNGGTAITINHSIFKSGKQNVMVKLSPLYDQNKITENVPFTMKIGYKDYKENGTPWHWILEMPHIQISNNGIPEYFYQADFEANVPYETYGYLNCIDLRQISNIENIVVEKFNEIRTLILNKQYEILQQIQLNKYYELALSLYQKSDDVLKNWQDDIEKYEKANTDDYLEIKDYCIKFYAGGRLVTLEKQTKEFGWFDSALMYIKESDTEWECTSFTMYWGMLKTGNDLVLIR